MERLYTEARLQVRRRRRKKIPVADRQPLVRPQAPNEVWSADFVFDRPADGRVVKCLTVVDDATTEAVAIVPARTLGGLPVTRVLDRLAFERGLPRVLRTACYEQVVKALGAVGPSNRGTDTGSGSVEPAHRASSGLIPEERRVPGGSTSSCLRGVVAQIKCEVERDPDETGGMKSRVHPKYKTKYRVRNWASYERALIGRGNITIWLSRAAIAARN